MSFRKQPWMGALLAIGIALSLPAAAQLEDIRTRQLMQDVAELQRTVRQQALRIDQLEREIARLSGAPVPRTPVQEAVPAPDAAKQPWLAPARWDRVSVGMSELEVLDILGYPTSTRVKEGTSTKTLFYSMQVGPTGFLSGNVELEDRRVRAVQKPTLR